MKTVSRVKAEKMSVTEKMMAGFPVRYCEIVINELKTEKGTPFWEVTLAPFQRPKKFFSKKKAEEYAVCWFEDFFCSPFAVNKVNILWRGVKMTIPMSR